MSVRKRSWTTTAGEERESWVVDYFDAGGTRRLKTFKRKKDADAWSDATGTAVRDGVHVADGASVRVREAARLWLATCEANQLEPATIAQYRSHIDYHLVPLIGGLKLAALNAPTVRNLEDKLIAGGRSPTLTRYVLRSLGSMLADSQERRLVARNVVRDLKARRRRRGPEERRGSKLKIGVDIPTPQEIKALLAAATGRWRPFLLVAVFTGLRASELRGLRWIDLDLARSELHVRQRIDRYRRTGPPKTAAGERTVPLPREAVVALREWKVACPRLNGKLELVFPTSTGSAHELTNIVLHGLIPTWIAAGVTAPASEKPAGRKHRDRSKLTAKYTGLHSLRHFFASWCINRKPDGLELSPKEVQERLGHSSITMTYDRYGHLFPRRDDNGELNAASQLLLS